MEHRIPLPALLFSRMKALLMENQEMVERRTVNISVKNIKSLKLMLKKI